MSNFIASFNQLEGMIPTFFGNMSNLNNLSLGDNHLKGGIPDFTSAPNLEALRIENNQFTFEDILPHIDSIEALIDRNNGGLSHLIYGYQPQDSIFKDSIIITQGGTSLSIDLLIDDTVTTNRYQWYKDGEAFVNIEGNNELSFSSLKKTDAGIYRCDITNPNVPELTLKSHNITLVVGENICVQKDSLALIALYLSLIHI